MLGTARGACRNRYKPSRRTIVQRHGDSTVSSSSPSATACSARGWAWKSAPRDLAAGQVTVARRLSGGKAPLPLAGIAETVVALLGREQRTMLDGAQVAPDARIADVDTVPEAIQACAQGWARLPWSAVGEAGEDELAQSAITVRCLTRADGSLPDSDTEPGLVAYVARSY